MIFCTICINILTYLLTENCHRGPVPTEAQDTVTSMISDISMLRFKQATTGDKVTCILRSCRMTLAGTCGRTLSTCETIVSSSLAALPSTGGRRRRVWSCFIKSILSADVNDVADTFSAVAMRRWTRLLNSPTDCVPDLSTAASSLTSPSQLSLLLLIGTQYQFSTCTTISFCSGTDVGEPV